VKTAPAEADPASASAMAAASTAREHEGHHREAIMVAAATDAIMVFKVELRV
jgi:hypothetical protein